MLPRGFSVWVCAPSFFALTLWSCQIIIIWLSGRKNSVFKYSTSHSSSFFLCNLKVVVLCLCGFVMLLCTHCVNASLSMCVGGRNRDNPSRYNSFVSQRLWMWLCPLLFQAKQVESSSCVCKVSPLLSLAERTDEIKRIESRVISIKVLSVIAATQIWFIDRADALKSHFSNPSCDQTV